LRATLVVAPVPRVSPSTVLRFRRSVRFGSLLLV